MTHYVFVTRSDSNSIHDNEENLIRNKKLIILIEAIKYCEKNGIDRLRYTDLKNLSNNKLASLTEGQQTDFGGSFDKYIIEFESLDDPVKRFVERQKKRRKESYIIPNTQKIKNALARKGLSNLIDEDPYSLKGVKTSENKNGRLSCVIRIGQIPDDINEIHIEREHKLYKASYYYENGRPVFVEDDDGWEKDPAPFYEDDNTCGFKVTEQISFAKCMKVTPVFISDPWKIHLVQPENKNILLMDRSIKQLLSIGESIISHDPGTSLGLAIEYSGSHNRS
jgi:hypothetical protein